MTPARTPTRPNGCTTASANFSPGSLPARSRTPASRLRRPAEMARLPLLFAGVGAVALAALLMGTHAPSHRAHAQLQPASAVCAAPAEFARFTRRLPRFAERVAQRVPVTIVAEIGRASCRE